MTDTKAIVESYSAIRLSLEEMEEQLRPLAEAYFDRIADHIEEEKYSPSIIGSHIWDEEGDILAFSEYELVPDEHPNAKAFRYATDEEGCYFYLPFSYVEDPEGYISNEMAEIARVQEIVERAYDRLAPRVAKERPTFRPQVVRVSADNVASAIVVEGDKKNGIYGYDPDIFVANAFTVDLETEEILTQRMYL